jgi:integrase/recombinase XerC
VPKPKVEKRLPQFFRNEAMETYFRNTEVNASEKYLEEFIRIPHTKPGKKLYENRLARLIISFLYSTGVRRSELISLDVGDVDFGRKVVKVVGKGNKMREIPLIVSLCEEILLYLKAVGVLTDGKRSLKSPLLMTYSGNRLYPAYVDRTVKRELGDVKGITGRRSPHVLRHSLATELMNEEADLNSIKEMLGHSSLATTQVYTHSSFARLKNIYEHAHPRAKNGGKHGD